MDYKSESNDIKIKEDLQNFFSSRFLISVFVLFSITNFELKIFLKNLLLYLFNRSEFFQYALLCFGYFF